MIQDTHLDSLPSGTSFFPLELHVRYFTLHGLLLQCTLYALLESLEQCMVNNIVTLLASQWLHMPK